LTGERKGICARVRAALQRRLLFGGGAAAQRSAKGWCLDP